MKDKMNLLFIAPLEEMRNLIEKIAPLYPNIETTILYGNEDSGTRVALESYSANYDCIISRGNTAALIRRAVSIPVIEVKVTVNDILVSLSEASPMPARVAAVGYNSVVAGLEPLKNYLPFALEIFGFDELSELGDIFDRLRQQDLGTIVCDAITYQYASMNGFDAYQIRSGEDSIRYAFDYAMLLYQASNSMLEENQLLRRLAAVNSESETVVFSLDKKLYYSSLQNHNPVLMDYLYERLDDFAETDKFKIIKRHAGYLYRISAKKVLVSGREYYAYFISRRTPDIQSAHKGIRYYTDREIQEEMDSSVFGIANLEHYYSSELNMALQRKSPVLIFGDVGVGKNHLAEMIFLNSQYTKNPFVYIDFTLLSHQTWSFLINSNDSPLCDSGNTLFLKNIDALDRTQLTQLLAALSEGDVSKRNRILISCAYRRNSEDMELIHRTIMQLNCLTINMHPLQGQYGTIEQSAALLLSDFRQKQNPLVGEFQTEALSALLHFSWPQNYHQLIRVVNEAATLAGNGPITAELVTEILSKEMFLTPGETSISINSFLDLSKPLSEINSSIVRILLDQNDGNQTLTAKSLGISRTTMWRMLKGQSAQKDTD